MVFLVVCSPFSDQQASLITHRTELFHHEPKWLLPAKVRYALASLLRLPPLAYLQSTTAVTTPNTLWDFCPSSAAAYLFTILFGLTMLVHLGQGIYHRKGYCWVITMGALWQTLTYIFRILSIQNPAALSEYAAWFVLILVSSQSDSQTSSRQAESQ